MRKVLIGFVIAIAVLVFVFTLIAATAPQKVEGLVQWVKSSMGIGKPNPLAGTYVFVGKEWPDFEKAVQPTGTSFMKYLEDQGLLKDDKVLLEALVKELAKREVLFKLFEERGLVDEKGNLLQDRLYMAVEPQETSLAKALRDQGFLTEEDKISLKLFEGHLRRQGLGNSQKEFPYPLGIRYAEKADGTLFLEGVPPVFEKFDLWGDKDISKAFKLLERYDRQPDIRSTVELKRQMLEAKAEGKKVFVAADDTFCYPFGFEVVTNLSPIGEYRGHHSLYPKASVYHWDLTDEIHLPEILPFLKRDTNFKGNVRTLKNAILQKNPRFLWSSGALKPGKIIVNPMERSWEPVEMKFTGIDEIGEGVLLMLYDRTSINERMPFIKRFVSDKELRKMSPSEFLEAIKTHTTQEGKKPFVNSFGEVQFPIGVHLSLAGGDYVIFPKEELTAHLPRRPVIGGGYEVDIIHDFHLYTALNYLKVDAGYSTTFGFADLEKDIVSRYPKRSVDGRVVFPFTLRVTPKKGTKKGGYDLISLGHGDLHIFLTDQREEEGIIRGVAERPIQLTEVARLLRMYGNPNNFEDLPLPAYDGMVVMEAVLEKSYYRYPSGAMRPVEFWIDTRTGAYGFDLPSEEEPVEEEKPTEGSGIPEGTEDVSPDPEGEPLKVYTINAETLDQYRAQMEAFAQEQGIDNIVEVEAYLKRSGIRIPFAIQVNPEGSDVDDPYTVYNLPDPTVE